MDLAIAIGQINPEYEYTLNDDKTAIAEWRSSDPQPTQAELEAAWDAYEWETGLSPAMPIVKVGSVASVTVQGKPGAAQITIDDIAQDIEIDASGTALLEFPVDSVSEYVVEAFGHVAIIKAV